MFPIDLTIGPWHIIITAALIVAYGELRASYTKASLTQAREELVGAVSELDGLVRETQMKIAQKILYSLILQGLLFIDTKGNIYGFKNKIITAEQMKKDIEKFSQNV